METDEVTSPTETSPEQPAPRRRGPLLLAALRDGGALRGPAHDEIVAAIGAGCGVREQVAEILDVPVSTLDKIFRAEPLLRLRAVSARREAGKHDSRNGNAAYQPRGVPFAAGKDPRRWPSDHDRSLSRIAKWISQEVEGDRQRAALRALSEMAAGGVVQQPAAEDPKGGSESE